MTDTTGTVPDALASRLERLLHDLLSRRPLKQAVLAVESGDRSLRWSGAAGEANPDGTPVLPDTPFFIASIDKLLNATVAMHMCERGTLNLDASIADYLPETVVRGLHVLDGTDRSSEITVRHLLGHTSGLPDWLEDNPRGGRSLVDRIVSEGDLALDIEDVAAIVRDDLRPHFPPQDLTAAGRQRIRYSDTNYLLLIGILEQVNGRPLHRVLEDVLFRPLDLRNTFLPGWSQPPEPTAEPAILRVDGRPFDIPLLIRSFRGVCSTAADLLTFLRAFVRGEIFDDPATPGSMQARWNRFGVPFDRAALRAPGWPIEYGLALMRYRLPRLFTPFRRLPAVIGHTGSTGSWLFHCQELDLLIAGNVGEVTAGAVPFRLVPRILRAVAASR